MNQRYCYILCLMNIQQVVEIDINIQTDMQIHSLIIIITWILGIWSHTVRLLCSPVKQWLPWDTETLRPNHDLHNFLFSKAWDRGESRTIVSHEIILPKLFRNHFLLICNKLKLKNVTTGQVLKPWLDFIWAILITTTGSGWYEWHT